MDYAEKRKQLLEDIETRNFDPFYKIIINDIPDFLIHDVRANHLIDDGSRLNYLVLNNHHLIFYDPDDSLSFLYIITAIESGKDISVVLETKNEYNQKLEEIQKFYLMVHADKL